MNMRKSPGHEYLAELLEVVQRCAYFLDGSSKRLEWPLTGKFLADHRMDIDVFETVAAINERFAKLQDTLGAAMRHAAVLGGEQVPTFLRVLAFYEKIGVLISMRQWQECRATRNLAAHDYDTDYAVLAGHFNALHAMTPFLYETARRFVRYCREELDVEPKSRDFAGAFQRVTHAFD